MRRRILFSVVVVAFALACAVSEPPSGGPEDKDPPAVVGTTPAADSTGVDPSSPIAITFGEHMQRARVERLVSVQPPITIDRVRWEGQTLVIEPAGGLQRDTTYVVRLKPGYRDRHGVAGVSTREFAFATGATLDTASISGQVLFKREPSGKSIVRAFRVPRDTTFRADAARPDREVVTQRDGSFRLRYLPANDARFVMMAYVDQNGNGTFDSANEPYTVLPDTFLLTAAVPKREGVRVDIIDPNEPGSVAGEVANETGIDTVRTSLGLYGLGDSTRAEYLTHADTLGAYAFSKVKPGTYRLWAFLDLRADSIPGTYPCELPEGCREPSLLLVDSLLVSPGGSVSVPRLILKRGGP